MGMRQDREPKTVAKVSHKTNLKGVPHTHTPKYGSHQNRVRAGKNKQKSLQSELPLRSVQEHILS